VPAAPATIVPMIAFPPATPFTLQEIPVAGLPDAVRVALKTCAVFVGTVASSGEIFMAMLSVIVTVAEPEAVASAALIAVIVTLGDDGRIAGAV